MRLNLEIELGKYIIDILPLVVLLLIVFLVVLWRRKRNPAYLFCFSLFGIYFLYVLDVAIFPIPITGAFADAVRAEGNFMSHVNLVPFYFGTSLDSKRIFINTIQNIILTIPFGFGISFIVPLREKGFRWVVIAGCLGIEVMQLVISLGVRFTYRVIDVNDVFLNAVGVLVGYGLFRVFSWSYLIISERFSIEHEGLSAYIHNIASQA